MDLKNYMSRILAIQAVFALVGVGVIEAFRFLAVDTSYGGLNLFRAVNVVIAIGFFIGSSYAVHYQLNKIVQLIDGKADEHKKVDPEYAESIRGQVLRLPDNIFLVSLGLIIFIASIFILLNHFYEGSLLADSASRSLMIIASWCLVIVMNSHVVRENLLSVTNLLSNYLPDREISDMESPKLLRKFVSSSFVTTAITGGLIGIVMYNTMEIELSITGIVWRAIGVYVLTQLLAYFNMLFLARSVVNPLRELADLTLSISNGNLVGRFNAMTDDEVEFLGRHFNVMVRNLRSMAIKLREVMTQVSTVSEDIFDIAEQQTGRAEERAVVVTQISANMEHLGKTAQQIADHCEIMATHADEALERAVLGQQAVSDTAEGMDQIKDTVAAMSKHILSLGEKSKQIGDIIDTISSMADETHLLSLNAAIESAAAGEHGRRFGVVAAEVKRLAERSVNATKDIKKILTEIQMAANSSVLATEQGLKEVEKGAELAGRARGAINDVIKLVEGTTAAMKEISAATDEQKQSNLQVITSMRETTSASKQAATANKQTRNLAKDLKDLADQLEIIVRLFNVGEEETDAI